MKTLGRTQASTSPFRDQIGYIFHIGKVFLLLVGRKVFGFLGLPMVFGEAVLPRRGQRSKYYSWGRAFLVFTYGNFIFCYHAVFYFIGLRSTSDRRRFYA